MSDLRLGILGSTRGSNLPPLYAAMQQDQLKAEFALVLSNKAQAGILEKAQQLDIPNQVLVLQASETRAHYDQRLIEVLEQHDINVVILIGYMRILTPEFIHHYAGRILNVHPSLLPKHAGLMDLAVHTAVLQAQETETGCTVHLVEEDLDSGPIVVQKRCAVLPNNTAETLKQRVQALEIPALIEAIQQFNKRT